MCMSSSNRVEAVYRRDYIQDIAAKQEAIGRAYWRRENVLLAPLMLVYLIVGCLFVVMADAFVSPMLPGTALPLRLALSVLFGGLLAYVINGIWFDSVWNMVVRQGLVTGSNAGDIRVRIDDAGVQWTTTDSEVFLAWNGVERIALRDTAMVFLNTPDTYYIPRLAFGTDADLVLVLERDILPRMLIKARDLTEQDPGIRALVRKPEPKAAKVKVSKKPKKALKNAAAGVETDAINVDASSLDFDPSAVDRSALTEVVHPDAALAEFEAAPEFGHPAFGSQDVTTPDFASAEFTPPPLGSSEASASEAAFDTAPIATVDSGSSIFGRDRDPDAVSADEPVARRGFFGRSKKAKVAPSFSPTRLDVPAEPVFDLTPVETFAALELPFTASSVDPSSRHGEMTAAAPVSGQQTELLETQLAPPVFGKLGSQRSPSLRGPALSSRPVTVVPQPAADRPASTKSDFAGFIDDIAPPAGDAATDWPVMSPLLDQPPFMAKAGMVATGAEHAARGPSHPAGAVKQALTFDPFDTPRSPMPEPANRAPTPAPAPSPPPSKSSSMFWPAPVSAWPALSSGRRHSEPVASAQIPIDAPIGDQRAGDRDLDMSGAEDFARRYADGSVRGVGLAAETVPSDADLLERDELEPDPHAGPSGSTEAGAPDASYWRLGKRKIRGRIRRFDAAGGAGEWPVR